MEKYACANLKKGQLQRNCEYMPQYQHITQCTYSGYTSVYLGFCEYEMMLRCTDINTRNILQTKILTGHCCECNALKSMYCKSMYRN